ncbi:MAG: LemA family protein [Alcanivoracaceae bacterium]|nr:LemA family protein [Alcanivoracaceae bacterium]
MGPWIVLAIIVGSVIFVVSIYNRLIALRNRFKNAFAQIDVQLQRRHDLIPNLVESAKAYMAHEKDTLSAVTDARSSAMGARSAASNHPDNGNAVAALGKAESMLSGALANFLAVSENYPELRANENISQLMEELSSTENRIGFSRQAFNDAVMTYNTYREQFPNNFIGGLFGRFEAAQLLKIETEAARIVPKVSF